MRKGQVRGILKDADQRRLRALMMLDFKVRHTASNAEVAEEFNVSERTVERAMRFLKKQELVAKAEDKVLSELLPASHQALKDVLAQTDDLKTKANVAIEIFKGTLPSFQKTKPQTIAAAETSLDDYLAELKGELAHSSVLGELLEGEVVGPEPAAEAKSPAEGHDAPAGGDTVGTSASPSSAEAVGLGSGEGTPARASTSDGLTNVYD